MQLYHVRAPRHVHELVLLKLELDEGIMAEEVLHGLDQVLIQEYFA